MLPDSKIRCPYTAFARSCREIVAACDCPKFVHVQFTNPQTGELIDKYGCADAFAPLLTILNAQAANQTAAAVESFRNEVVKANESAVQERREVLADLLRPQSRLQALG
jgi:hypothetical protein